MGCRVTALAGGLMRQAMRRETRAAPRPSAGRRVPAHPAGPEVSGEVCVRPLLHTPCALGAGAGKTTGHLAGASPRAAQSIPPHFLSIC
ncbi:hypothetical protein AAFF_G00148490 [Aldrovandia affinis]|uniref:Uncharacterized protein n=1 Tax=Aldrovandia affinis TaxID=143900 RepID=A0AAD7W925_9TELE|nr:hypothetical protein AAFF_G00148490 [Aldrovandia affinis]